MTSYSRYKILLPATSSTAANCREPGREARAWPGGFDHPSHNPNCSLIIVLPWPLLLLGTFDSAGIPSLPPQPLPLPSLPVPMPLHLLLLPLLVPRVRGGGEEVGEGVEDLWRPLLQPGDKNQVHSLFLLSCTRVVFKIICIFTTHSTSFTLKPNKTRCSEYNTWFTECVEGNSTEVAIRTRLWALVQSRHILEDDFRN